MRNIAFLFILLLLLSCSDVIELDLSEAPPSLVVEGEINNRDGRHIIKLSLSRPFFETDDFSHVTADQIRLYQNNQLVALYTDTDVVGEYQVNFRGNLINRYHVEIDLPNDFPLAELAGQTIISTQERIWPVPAIDQVNLEFRSNSIFSEEGYYLSLNMTDNPNRDDFYRWRVRVNGQRIGGLDGFIFTSDELFRGNELRNINMNDDPLEVGDTVLIEQMSITSGFYDYLSLVFEQLSRQGGFFETQPANARGNFSVKNSGDSPVILGYFNAAAIVRVEATIDPENFEVRTR
ncbi:DUF4249 domain-containing protein [Penaeicola halotolerans]|uniref:DUF4249 domain-containing protein n=1 Tax=Penaeicola halotolerans TaxID=2793196 RepID=UPI001CF8C735|nr:DUF4249 domain-containing protein [Penaeicola halotolerans]